METVLAFVVGITSACSVFLLLRGSIIKMILGLVLLGQSVNLLIFTSGSLVRGIPALVKPGKFLPEAVHSDPLPQALILTAIVIGFGVLTFSLVLIRQTYKVLETDDLDEVISSDS